MRKVVKPKIIYKYVVPKTPEEAKEQQERIDRVFDMIFDHALQNIKKRKK